MKRLILTPYCIGLGLGLVALATNARADKGALYITDNAANANNVLVFDRDADGTLSPAGSVATGGTGTGAAQGLPSQGSVLLSDDGRWLFVCNAGSSEISVFSVSPHGLTMTGKVASRGWMPVSLGLCNNLLYVLNAGGLVGHKDNITAFVFKNGTLTPLPNSTRALSADNTGPAQVSFTADGDALVVTERLTSLIDTFLVDHDGLASMGKSFASAGATPFGFDVGKHDRVFVSEAAGSASSYHVSEDGDLTVISGAVPTQQAAPCWLITSQNGHYVYTANAGAGSISGFRVGHHGTLELLDANGQTGVTGAGSHPTDMALSNDGRFLYSLNNGNGTISAFQAMPDGSLQSLTGLTGLPTTAAGLAGR